MFWKRVERRSANAAAIANTFGEAHAHTFETAEKLAATADLVTLYLSALRLAQKTAPYESGIAQLLAAELSALAQLPESERIEGLTGYVALSSLLDRLTFVPTLPGGAVIPMLRAVNNHAPLWKCTPLQEWIDLTQGLRLDAAPLLFSWEHVCCVYLQTLSSLYTNETTLDKSDESLPLLEPRMFKMLQVINHAAWRQGMVNGVGQDRPDDAKVAYLVAAQVVYERFRNGSAVGLLDDLHEAASGGMMRNYVRAVPAAFRPRRLTDSIPDGLLRDEPSFLTTLQMTAVIDGSMITASQKATLLRDGINHQERITYLAHHDPIVPLSQTG